MRRLVSKWKTWMNTSVKIKQVLPAYVVLAVGGTLSVWQFDQLSSQRVADVSAQQEAIVFTQCMTRVEVRETLREVLLGITAQFPPEDPGVQAVFSLIEREYPALDPLACVVTTAPSL